MQPSTSRAIGLFLLSGLLLPLMLSGQSSGLGIQGTVLDASTGKGINGVVVSVIRTTLPPLTQNIKSTADGQFAFSNLPAAVYRICAQISGGGYLNPCIWTPNPLTITLSAGQSATNVQLKLTPGSVLSVRINDPGNLLGKIGKASQAPPLSLRVRTSTGFFESLVMRSADGSGSEHEVTIPYDSPVPLLVHSPKLSLTQIGGSAVPAAGLSLPVTHSSTAKGSPPQIAFQITGINP